MADFLNSQIPDIENSPQVIDNDPVEKSIPPENQHSSGRLSKIVRVVLAVVIIMTVFGTIFAVVAFYRKSQPPSEVIASSTPQPTQQLLVKPTPTPTLKPTPTPKPKPTTEPTTAPTPTPKPKPIADYFAEGIKIIGAPNNSTTLQETSSVHNVSIEALFRNNEMIESTGTVTVKVYYDGIFKTELNRGEYGAFAAQFAYQPPTDPGTHTVRMVINESHVIAETNYGNNEQSITYVFIPDSVPPTFRIDGPYEVNGQTCMRWVDLVDNAFTYTDVWAKWKIDDGNWSSKTSENPYGCVTATTGSSHTYSVQAEDLRGNISEKSVSFTSF